MRIFILASTIALSASLVCQESQVKDQLWQYQVERDPLHGQALQKFILMGKYSTPPRTASLANPALVLVCSAGKVQSNYVAAGAVIHQRVDDGRAWINGEVRIDGKPEMVVFDSLSTDGTAAYFGRKDLKKALLGNQVLIGLEEFLGPEVVMEFQIPNPAPLEAACGQDRALKDIFKKRSAGTAVPASMPAEAVNTHSPQVSPNNDWTTFTPAIIQKLTAQSKQIAANSQAAKQSPAAITDSAQMRQLMQTGEASLCVILSDPSGADVYIDGKHAAVTPVTFTLRKQGDTPRVITVKKQGYRTIEKKITPDGRPAALDLTLENE